MHTRIKVILIAFFIANTLFLKAQLQNSTPLVFYRHYTGHLDSNMQVSVDLFSHNGIIEGQYYYFFNIPGTHKKHFGKTILLSGNIMDSRLEMHEVGNINSKFTGLLEGDSIVTGHWQRKKHEKAVKLYLREDYSNGSLPLLFLSKISTHKLNAFNEKTGNPIQAVIDLQVLYPESQKYKQANDTINYWISRIVMNDLQPVSSTELLVENIIFDFFQSYVKATSGIENIGRLASFNWEKKFNMRILYNENGLLSVQFTKYAFTGGAHGMQMCYFKVFNISDFEPISLEDIFDESSQIEIGKLLEKKLRKLNGIAQDVPLRENGFFIDILKPSNNFYLNHDGICFFYNVYEIASYASGTTEIFLPYSEIKQWINKNYLPKQ